MLRFPLMEPKKHLHHAANFFNIRRGFLPILKEQQSPSLPIAISFIAPQCPHSVGRCAGHDLPVAEEIKESIL